MRDELAGGGDDDDLFRIVEGEEMLLMFTRM